MPSKKDLPEMHRILFPFYWKTTIAYEGLQADRQVTLNNSDYNAIVDAHPEKCSILLHDILPILM